MIYTPIFRRELDLGEFQPNSNGSVFVALGNFDGVHRGHMELLNAARRGARLTGAHHSAVFTFHQGKAPAITTVKQRFPLFSEAGIREMFVADFYELCDQTPEEFVFKTLRAIGAVGVCCGFNFRFGKNAAGDVNTLQTLCQAAGMACTVVPAFTLDGEIVSSTRIRGYLQAGEMEAAAKLLGRPWALADQVEMGRRVGGSVLSTPTINLPVDPSRQLPPYGVYFTQTRINETIYPSITNLGIRPTFGESEILCETHLLGADGCFYGKDATVEFLKFHRPEQKFSSPEELAKVIAEDIRSANDFFERRQANA